MKNLKRTLALTLVLCMLCSLLPVGVLAAETAPTTNLSTTGSPFQQGVGGSNSFRIPALVTLSDGTLLAAADVRWNTTYDGGGLDTMVAISEDDGATWTHSFANYLGDNGNAYNSASSCFIDPSLAVYTTDVDNDGVGEDTIYMLCDLYPNGVALNGAKQCTPSIQTGFNASGYLKLTTVAPSTSANNYIDSDFTHYLKDGMIYSNDGTPVSGLSVNDHFNVTGTYDNKPVNSNLFFADSPFHVARTGFLYLTKSTDGGKSWSAPRLLNLKTSSEMVCLVGPNGGMVTSNGVIVFPVYSYTDTTEQTGLIYSDDDGATWQRSPNFTGSTSKSSEADVVELDNGKLRVFYRNTSAYLCYADYDLSTNTWSDQVNTPLPINSNTELSAITYSKSVIHNGVEKTVILVSCPASANLAGSTNSDGSWRTSGRIFAGLVDPDTCKMTWLDNSVQVTPVATSQLSGSTFTAEQGFFAYSSMTEKKDGSVYMLYENNQYGWGAASNGSNYYTITSKTFTESDLEQALGVEFIADTEVMIDDSGVEVAVKSEPDNVWEMTVTPDQTVAALSGADYAAYDVRITRNGAAYNGSAVVTLPLGELAGIDGLYPFVVDATSGTVTKINSFEIDEKLETITFTCPHFSVVGVAVELDEDAVNVTLEIGETKEFTDNSGYYVGTNVTHPDANIATMELTGTIGTSTTSLSDKVTAIESGKTYVLHNTSANKLMSNEWANASVGGGGTDGLALGSTTANFDQNDLWTITAADGGWYVQDQNGKYLSIAYGKAEVKEAPVVISLAYDGTDWTIGENGWYGNNYGGANSVIAGWSDINDGNSQWYIYEVITTVVDGTTTISFTGESAGKTTAVVGDTTYNITVTSLYEHKKVDVLVGESVSYTDVSGVQVVANPDGTIATMTVTEIPASIKKVSELVSGKQYIIANQKTGKVLTDNVIQVPGGWGNKTGLEAIDGLNAACTELWTITVDANGKYTILQDGKYLVASGYYADMSTTATGLNVAYNAEKQAWTIMDNVTKEAPTEYFLSAFVGDYYEGGVLATSDTNNEYIYWDFYEVVPASTEITFTGITPGKTSAIVGGIKYDITVAPGYSQKDVVLSVGLSESYVDDSGVYDTYTITDPSIVDVRLTAGTQPTVLTSIALNDTFYIMVREGVYLTKDYGTTTDLAQAETWTVVNVGTNFYDIKNSEGLHLGGQSRNGPTGVHSDYGYVDFNDGEIINWYNNEYIGIPVKATTATTNGTQITFTAKAVGQTTVVVGYTKYNITVTPAGVQYVTIELEIGEDFTYTDTTGNHSNNIVQQPNDKVASMTVSGTANSTVKKLVPLTGATFDKTKRYVIENVRAKGNQRDHSVLSSVELTGGYTGLDMIEALNENSPTWIFTPDDNYYLISRNGEYLYFTENHASMENAAAQITVQYVEGKGFTLYFNGYYLSDWNNTTSGEAFGSATADDGIYWNIYEVVTEQVIDATKVTFTGVTEGNTTAIVGNTQYIIKVVHQEIDDEVMNSATGIWTVDAEIQRQRYNALIGLHKDLYTDASWKEYETARQAAYKKLVEVTNKQYQTKAEAEAALDELTALVDALKTAHGKLVSATTIAVRYRLNTATGKLIDTREYKIASTDTSVTLPDTIVVGDIAYKVSNTTLNRQGAETSYDVVVTELGKIGGGFVGSADINAGTHNGHAQICDLVDDNNTGKKITEMTVTVGVSYDLNLATDTTGRTVTWTTDDGNVATVDQNGLVTAEGVGTTNIIATITDANGNIVEVNSIPITVYPTGSDDRNTAIYIEDIDNTTVWCVVNGDTQNYGFEVIEGELIYGRFDKVVSNNTHTTAMSFFADPDEAHALVYMKSTGSDDHYFLLHDNDGYLYDGTQTGGNGNYYVSGQTSGAGWWQAVGLNDNVESNTSERWQIVKDMVQWAINLGCDGGLGFTRRQSEGDLASNLTFASDPMARIEKEVDGVLPTSRKQADYRRYTENMVAAVHELVYFKITVTLEAPTQWKPQTDANGKIIRDSNGNIQYVTDENGNHFSAITYSSAMVTDYVLPGAYLYTKELDQADGTWDGEIAEGFRKQDDDVTDELNAAWTAEELAAGKRVLEYYLVYEIQESDIPKFYIDNIANLTYGYQSHYSKGAQAAAADAEARISVVGSAIDNVVIDFGQPFTYEGHKFTSITDGKSYTFTGLTNVHLKGAYVDGENGSVSKATAKYGDVKVYRKDTGKVDDKGYPEYTYTVTYTPHSILQGVDAVQIYGMGENDQEKVINGFLVYPATTVYYEEGFVLNNNNGWDDTHAKKATVDQTFELLGASQFDEHGMMIGSVSNLKHNYGFDPIYDGITAENNAEADKSKIYTTQLGASTQFTFTGTGFELFANCTEMSGYVSVAVTNAAGENVKMFMVNTVVRGGHSSATDGQTGDMASLPIVSLKDLPHGTYTVTLTKVLNDGKTVYIDGVRITNTIADSSIYTIDLEDNPEFYQLRDYVLKAINIQDYLGESMYSEDIAEGAKQVYAGISTDSEAPSAILTSVGNIYTGVGDAKAPQDLLDNGPKNEIYLWASQTLTFDVTTSRLMQIGLKAPRNATSYTMKVDGVVVGSEATALSTPVDLFYELGNMNGTEKTYRISITNTGSDIVAITDLKICDDPTAAFTPLTLKDIENILREAGYTDGTEPEVPEIPEEPEQPEIPMHFVDVPEGAYYYLPVVWAVKNGITNGISLSHFGSEMDCNRAQVVTFLWRAAGSPKPTTTENPFKDVKEGDFYYDAVLWAVENKITNGISADQFGPAVECNRAQVVTFLYRALGQPEVTETENPFSDVQAGQFYTDAVAWAVANSITNGMGNGIFGIGNICNRAQVVTFLYRAYN